MGDEKLPIIVLDGGLGTTLEDVFHRDISNPLWSARPIEHEPEVIIEAHLSFLRAGARIITAATYQCAYNTFENAGYTRADAQRIMRKAIRLARTAKERFLAEQPAVGAGDIKIALSFGPYGSTVNANEFDGMYPPPFGPEDPERNTFLREEDDRYEQSLQALKNFHLERLAVFSEDDHSWNAIDWIAFETVPLRREAIAIRMAMAELAASGVPLKPWWISTVHPFGTYPEPVSAEESGDGGHLLPARQLVHALLGQSTRHPTLPVPTAVGINCTGVTFLPDILRDMSAATKHLQSGSTRDKPMLVVYPNGKEWDLERKTWTHPEAEDQDRLRAWDSTLVGILKPYVEAADGAWGGFIVGGCCKSGPAEIAALASRIAQL
ncbi:hypothetical protein PHLGIDRAFT_422040 [Phlebiopsis gigantea 11061_1 CR5-6]|uniref:Hcy-binding domain-containing protein n=1 Tax=Phlebiopsis gigantea (strain 11061_1 CR5-6) TaxID=745531 RepID=A0A0C3PLM3_PHLG1|nr:hypothetical protein PHLGIDRAFT_422040 [Phlebiopsis gigantea 11061_1 CR5-6]